MTSSAAELLLEEQLRQAGIPFEREYRFAPPRRWRFDFNIWTHPNGPQAWVAVEIDGGAFVAGRHTRGTGFERDLEKLNSAALLGYRVLRFTPAMVDDGRALAVIRQALGLAAAA